MKNMKVSMKLIVSFLVVTALAVTIGAVGIFSLTSAADNTALLSDRTEMAIVAARMNRNIQAQRAAFRGAAVYHVMNMTGQRDTNLADLDTLEADYEALHGQVVEMLITETGRSLVANIDAAYAPFSTEREEFTTAIIDPATSNEVMVAQLDTVASTVAPLADSVAALVDFANGETTRMAAEAETTAARTTVILVVILIVAVVIAMFLAFYISGLISKPLKDMMGYIRQAGETGNLHFRDEEWQNCDRLSLGKDEIGQTMKAFTMMMRKFVYYGEAVNTVAANDLTIAVETLGDQDTFGNAIASMVGSLNSMFKDINTASNQVSTGSVQIADGAQLLAQGATEQSATVQQLSASVTEVNGQTKANAALADDAKKLGEDIRVNAERGNRQMEQMIGAVGEISDASTAIGKVIKIIDDIAFQTNILALNAAVEAARAGQHGKGFAVVADEVRSLAAKSAEAAKNTSELIATSIEKSEQGAAISKETAASLSQIVEGINQSSELVSRIAQSSNEQSVSMAQIGEAIDQVSQVIQQNSATAEESAAASEEMSGQASMLKELISQFKLKGEGIGSASVHTAHPSQATRSAPPSTGMSLGGSSGSKY